MNSIVKTLARSVREYKKTSILTPLLVTVEVVMECAIPFVIANLVNQMQRLCPQPAQGYVLQDPGLLL